jgi:hypothetical protein
MIATEVRIAFSFRFVAGRVKVGVWLGALHKNDSYSLACVSRGISRRILRRPRSKPATSAASLVILLLASSTYPLARSWCSVRPIVIPHAAHASVSSGGDDGARSEVGYTRQQAPWAGRPSLPAFWAAIALVLAAFLAATVVENRALGRFLISTLDGLTAPPVALASKARNNKVAL